MNQYTSKPIQPEIRFWSHVDRNGPIPEHRPELGQCWIWTASKHPKGYGQLKFKNKSAKAHKIAWEITFGNVPVGIEVCHACDNPSCVNPNHLWLGTHYENTQDMTRKERFVHKITYEQAKEIRARYEQGSITQAKLAKEYGISQRQVNRIIHNQRWNRDH